MFALGNPRPPSDSHPQPASYGYYHPEDTGGHEFTHHNRSVEPYLSSRHHTSELHPSKDASSPGAAFFQSYQQEGAHPEYPAPPLSHVRQGQSPPILNTYRLDSSHSVYSSDPISAITAPASEHSGDSETSPSTPRDPPTESVRSRKARREKPRIELAPDQPPTTQGKPRARVYVACLQCRTRKIRCDGAKPACHNCSRRTNSNTECNYDPIPKRRGPDKTPGARQRMARDARNELKDGILSARRRRRRDTTSSEVLNHADRRTKSPQLATTDNVSPLTAFSNPIPLSAFPPQDQEKSRHEFSSISTLARSSYLCECSCHGLLRCPGFSALTGPKLTSDIAPSYRESFDLLVPVSFTDRGYIAELDERGNEKARDDNEDIGAQPSLNFSRKIWWDSLLSLYVSPTSNNLQMLSSSQREAAAHSITADLRFLFRASNFWFSFFHIPSFFGNFCDPENRERIQPSLVLALLAMATFWQSSEVGIGRRGRERALRFRDEAQGALEASFNAGWVDETLAQAAWLLALFEVCAHPRHSSSRATSALIMLDSIIRSLSLTLVDADDPNTSVFSPGSVPAVPERSGNIWVSETIFSSTIDPTHQIHHQNLPSQPNGESGCSCKSLTLGEHWQPALDHAPLWAPTPAWDEAWSEGEIRKESCRRLCWSSMMIAAGHISYTTAQRNPHVLDLFISNPANYALLFSGESVARSPSLPMYSSKETIWALHDRSFLLWHGCIRMRNDRNATDNDKAQFAVKAWLEADGLETALNRHTCGIERAFIFQAREYIFNTRMCISYEFQRYVPLVSADVSGLFHRNKAEEWLNHQATVAQRFMLGLHTITGNSNNILARRPFFVFWFMGQISRALSLWQCDNTLTVALDLSKALLPAIDYLTALWPCSEQRYRYENLRERLDDACYTARVSRPPPPNLILPPSSPETLV